MTDLWLPAGGDVWTTFPRTESWWVDLLTNRDVPAGQLTGVEGWQVGANVEDTISGSGTLDVTDRGQGVDWLNARVQVWQRVEAAGQAQEWPLGVYLTSAPREAWQGRKRAWRIALLDKLAVLDGDEVTSTYSLPAGAVVTDAVRALIASTGETAIAVTDSPETLSAGRLWEVGTSKLRIINDLLSSIAYFSLRCDGYGRFVAAPWVEPRRRPVVRAFEPGSAAIHQPEWDRDEDLAKIPNVVALRFPGTGTTEGLTGVATNTDPASRFSYPRRGRWITATEQGDDATSQDVADTLAARRLSELSDVAATQTITHAKVPLDLNAIVRRTWWVDDVAVSTLASVRSWSASSVLDSMVRTALREVA